jgi:hypothetical protein
MPTTTMHAEWVRPSVAAVAQPFLGQQCSSAVALQPFPSGVPARRMERYTRLCAKYTLVSSATLQRRVPGPLRHTHPAEGSFVCRKYVFDSGEHHFLSEGLSKTALEFLKFSRPSALRAVHVPANLTTDLPDRKLFRQTNDPSTCTAPEALEHGRIPCCENRSTARKTGTRAFAALEIPLTR